MKKNIITPMKMILLVFLVGCQNPIALVQTDASHSLLKERFVGDSIVSINSVSSTTAGGINYVNGSSIPITISNPDTSQAGYYLFSFSFSNITTNYVSGSFSPTGKVDSNGNNIYASNFTFLWDSTNPIYPEGTPITVTYNYGVDINHLNIFHTFTIYVNNHKGQTITSPTVGTPFIEGSSINLQTNFTGNDVSSVLWQVGSNTISVTYNQYGLGWGAKTAVPIGFSGPLNIIMTPYYSNGSPIKSTSITVQVGKISYVNADVNGDGMFDLVGVSNPGGIVVTSLANSNGSYSPLSWISNGSVFAEGTQSWFLDINGDGKADLIYFNPSNGVIYVALNGSGFLSPTKTVSWDWVSPIGMIPSGGQVYFADANGDGKKDLVLINAGVVIVGLSNGTGFQQWSWSSGSRMIPTGGQVYFSDVSGDGKQDLVLINEGVVIVGLSNGAGGFGWWNWSSGGGTKMIPAGGQVYFADVNGDAKQDLVLINQGVVIVGLSNGTGGFGWWNWSSGGGTKMIPTGGQVYFADVNGDAKQDLVLINDGVVIVGLGNGTGGFGWWNWSSGGGAKMIPTGGRVSFADVNGDGKQDLILENQGIVNVGLGTNFGSFDWWTWSSVTAIN